MRDFPPLPLPTRPLTGSDTVNKIPEALMNAKFVYVRRGGQTPPLAPLYSGPYEVLEAGRKVFKISVGGKMEMFTVDRLKPHLAPGGDAAGQRSASKAGRLWSSRPLRRRL